MYSLQRWKPRTVKAKKHISHFTVADPQQIPQSQQVPGHCLLCPHNTSLIRNSACIIIMNACIGRGW